MRLALMLLVTVGAGGSMAQGARPPLTSAEVRRAADTSTRLRVVVSLAERKLWVIGAAGDTLRSAPVAVGSGKQLKLGARRWRFATPTGIRKVESIETDPIWIRPDWAYLELARQLKVRLDSIAWAATRPVKGGDSLLSRGREIGVVRNGEFTPWPVDKDIVLGGVLYMPPLGSPYRGQAGVLGSYRLNVGGAIGIHGTLDRASIGKAVTHGCMRLGDDDLAWLYLNVPIGTPVFIY
jgi:hypothetical protein